MMRNRVSCGVRRIVLAAGLAVFGGGAAFAAETVTVRPANHREPLVNPDMGLVAYHYSNRQWAYGQHLEPGDTLDWFPGIGCVYFRLPWCLLEPKEGEFRWDLIDTYARPWIAAGKQIAFRVTCCESRFTYATPEWVKDAGAKGWFFRDADPDDIWEPDYGDPVFLAKLEDFLRAMARRYDGKPYVAHIDVGTIGMWGEGHTRAYGEACRKAGRDPEKAVYAHYELYRKCFPRTTILCIDDQAGAYSELPFEQVPLMRRARELGFGWRDDSILVHLAEWFAKEHTAFASHPEWFHDGWARAFAPTAPVMVEHGHYGYTRQHGTWSDAKLVESVEDHQASWLSIHGWPRTVFEEAGAAFRAAALRIGYRFELEEVRYPAEIRLGETVDIVSTWTNVGVAPCYRGAFLAYALLDDRGRTVWAWTDETYNFKAAEPMLKGVRRPVTRTTRARFGAPGEIPAMNDAIWAYEKTRGAAPFAQDRRIPTLRPGTYTLAVSLGDAAGVPTLNLPLPNGCNKVYPIGKVSVR